MAKKKIRLQVLTPTETKFDKEIDMVIFRCMNGDMGVLPGHEARSAALDYGIMRIIEGEEERLLAIYSGIAEILDNVVTVVANDAEWPEDIDLAQAELDREQARQRLGDKEDDLEMQRAHVMLRRSLVQIEVSSYSVAQNRH